MSNIVPVKQAPLAGLAGYGGGVPGLYYLGAAGTSGFTLNKSLRFNRPDSAYLNRTPSSAGNRRTWTLSVWCKKTANGIYMPLINANNSVNPYLNLSFTNTDTIRWLDGSNQGQVLTNAAFRDNSAWYHIVCATDTTLSTATDRVKIYVNGVRQDVTFPTTVTQNHQTQVNNTTEHRIGRWLGTSSNYLNSYLADYYLIDGQALEPTSFGEFNDNGVWQAKDASDLTFGTNGFHLLDFANESTVGHDSSGNENDFTANNFTTGTTYSTNMTPSSTAYPNTTLSNGGLSWSGSTSNNTGTVSSLTIPTNKKTYVEVTHTTTGGGNPGPGVGRGPTVELGLDSVKAWWRGGTDGSATGSTLGSFTGTNTSWSNGDILGIALDHTANSGSGSITFYKYGTQIHTGGSGWTSYTDLRFEWQNNGSGTSSGTWNYGASAFSYPVSGHTGLLEEAGANMDVLFDVPTNGTQSDTGAGGEKSGNYPTWNPLSGQHQELSNGNLQAESGTISSYATIPSTIAMTSGKWYAEFQYIENINSDGDGSNFMRFGISQTDRNFESGGPLSTTKDFGFFGSSTSFRARTNGSNTYTYSGITLADGDILSLAFDADSGKLWVAKNGTFLTNAGGAGDPANGNYPDHSGLTYSGGYVFTAGPYAGAASPAQGGGRLSSKLIANWGARDFAYAAPSGFKALNTASLPTPTIADGSDYFEPAIWSGDSASSRTITTGFNPDMVWLKNRGVSGRSHYLYDAVRGFGANKELVPNTTDEEGSSNHLTQNHGYVSGTTSTGFTLAAGATNSVYTNQSGQTYVGWTWNAGSSTASNTDGSITSSVRASAASGFSIVSYTGNGSSGTVGHGLNAAPEMIIAKDRDAQTNWFVYHTSLGSNAILLNSTAASFSPAPAGINAASSTTFTLGGNRGETNTSGNDYIAYCFAPVAGYSAFGKTTGNNSTDGPFVFTGFRPRFIIWRPTASGHSWMLIDTVRDTYNIADATLRAQNNNAESHFDWGDVLSNGFKIRNTDTNPNNVDIIYAAWAENPFQANGGLAR